MKLKRRMLSTMKLNTKDVKSYETNKEKDDVKSYEI